MTRLAVVTGASRGIGRATALAFAARGVRVALLGRASAALELAAETVRSAGATAEAYACDVRDAEAVARAALAVVEDAGVPDVVVNNAGVVHRGRLVEETSIDSWDDVLAVNLRGPFLVTRAFLREMRERRAGRFIHVASISSKIGCSRNASYAASKWGLLGFAKSLAEELRGSGVVSVSVLPGSVDTDMLRGSGFEPVVTADEVARAIVHYGLDAPAAVHGAEIELYGS